MSSDEVDSKTEKMNDLDSHEDSKSGDEASEPVKATNSKVSKKKAPPAPKIKAPAKKRVKAEQAEKEAEKDAKEEEKKEEKKKEVKKKVEKSDEEDDEEEEEEEEEENEEDDHKNGIKKGVPLLDQPLEISGSRERKQVQRFSVVKSEGDDQKPMAIPEGSGKPLEEIPRIENNIQRFKVDTLKILHRVCFNRTGKAPVIKKNVRKFNGFDFDKDSSEYEKKKQMLLKIQVKDLKTLCMILDLPTTKKKEELVSSILKFLLKPEDSGKPLPEGRSKRKGATLKSYDESDSGSEVNSKKKSQKTRGKKKNLKEVSDSESEKEEKTNNKEDAEEEDEEEEKNDTAVSKSENESDVDEEEDQNIFSSTFVIPKDEPKKKKAKRAPAKTKEKKTAAAPPKKRAAAKRAVMAKKKKSSESDEGEDDEEDNAESGGESDEGDDEPLSKKGQAPPTDDEIKAYVKSILEGANLEEITMKTVCKQVYAHYPEFDLGHKKDFIKTTVKSLISS